MVCRSYVLVKVYVRAYGLLDAKKIQVAFFYRKGEAGRGGEVSGAFGARTTPKDVSRKMVGAVGLPPLSNACVPTSDEAEMGSLQLAK